MRKLARRGFLLSLDAIIAIGLILTLVLFIGGLSLTYHSPELRYQRLYYTGKDVLLLMENAKMSQLSDFPSVQYYRSIGVISDADNDKSLLDIVGSLWSSYNTTLNSYGSNLTADILNTTIPPSYGYRVLFGGDTIYQRGTGSGEFLARLSSIVSGIERGKPIDGYFSRAYPTKVGKTGYKYYYFGGYAGEGNLSVLVDLPDFEYIRNVSMELAASSDFSLLINGNPSGYYTLQTNESMRSNSWSVDSSHYSNFHNGSNLINIGFDEPYGYVGGGYVRIIYNTSDISADLGNGYGDNASKTYRLPGISGLMNLYDSFYVPGVLRGMEVFLHYETFIPGLTAYLSMGDVVLYESNLTGEINATIPNASIWGNLTDEGKDFSYFSGRTVPFRVGLRNISYVLGEAGAADVVLITDRTGSMTACDVDTDCVSGLCDSSDPCHDRRSLVAQESDREFVNTILDAEGRNYVGLIGYGERHGQTCSFLDITGSNATLQQRITDYNYEGSWQECGWTCTSCGVVGATELLQEKVALYNISLVEDRDTSLHSLSGSNPSDTITLDLGSLNKSRFIKSRLSLLVREEDPDEGYQQCIFINGNYLGRTCKSSEGSEDWHICTYPVERDWINQGSNSLDITSGTQDDCYAGGGYSWDAMDIKLSSWQFHREYSSEIVNSSSGSVKINTPDSYAEIREHEDDYPNPVDFSTDINQTGDTFGLGQPVDGWDEQEGTYGYSGSCSFNGESGGELEIYSQYTNEDKSCAYGIEFNVTPGIYSHVSSGGSVEIVFNYEWDESGSWESDDQVWVKGRITSPSGTCASSCYLGSDLDSTHPEGDAALEIYTDNDPDGDHSSSFRQDITSWIESSGTYYLDLGGKVLNSQSSEYGYFRFDNIGIEVYPPQSSEPVVEMTFPGTNLTLVRSALLSFEARGIDLDKASCVYVNDNHIGRIDYQEVNESDTWQEVRFDIPVIYLQGGKNYVEFSGGTPEGCNRTGENDQWEARNVEMTLVTSGEHYPYLRKKSMLIMSDGEANTVIGDCRNYDTSGCPAVAGFLTPAEETVAKACEAHDKYNITIYTVVFGDAGADAEDMLREAACCDNCSNFFSSTDSDELKEIYSRIAQGILNASYAAQTIELSLDIGDISNLYEDSFISINYSSQIDPPEYGEISLTFESPVLETMSGSSLVTDPATSTKEGWFYVPANVEVVDAQVTSYSSQYWTDRLYARNSSSAWSRIYWLDDFGALNYTSLGDPYIIDIPAQTVTSGDNNSIRIGTGFSPTNGTGGSPDSRIIYTGLLGGITLEGYSEVFEKANGSTVNVYYDYDGDNVSDGFTTIQVGGNPSDVFDPFSDAVDNAFMRLLNSLNVLWDANPGSFGNGSASDPYDGGITSPDNPIDFQIPPDIKFDSASISGVPSMWGPVELEVQVWV